MTKWSPHRMVVSCVAWFLAGCDPIEPTPSPTLQLVDSIRLAETESEFLGLPGGFSISEAGIYFIGDLQQSTVHKYAPDGTYLGRIGRPGEGPGEFPRRPLVLRVEGDSLFVLQGPALLIFSASTGDFVATRSLPVLGMFEHSIAVHDGRVFFRHVDPDARHTVGILTLASGSIEFGGPFPELLGTSPIIAQALSEVIATPVEGDTLLIAVRSSDHVYIGPVAGPFDSIRVAVLNRQGSRPDLLARIAADPDNAGVEAYTPSLPMALQRLSSGELVYVVDDLQLIDGRFTGRLFVSVAKTIDGTTCPDAPVPVPADPRPVSALRGDTLVVLSQEVSGAEPEAWVRKYVITTDGCEWLSG